MKKYIILFILLNVLFNFTKAQSPEANETKYWVWRDRLINDFMIPGNNTGNGIIFGTRGTGINYNMNGDWQSGGFMINDEGFNMGEYLAVLATEWKLLHNASQSTTNTEIELFWELKTIDRLDIDAETYWAQYWGNPDNIVCSSPNGFMIKDDVFDTFLKKTYCWQTGTSYDNFNYLNQGGNNVGKYVKQCIIPMNYSGNITNLVDWSTYLRTGNCTDCQDFSAADAGIHYSDGFSCHTGPTEYSQDNYSGLFLGLSTITSSNANLIPDDLNVTNPDNPSETINIKLKAEEILHRIIHYMKAGFSLYDDNNNRSDGIECFHDDGTIDNCFDIVNPITGMCVKGVEWKTYLTSQKTWYDQLPLSLLWPIDDQCNGGGAEAGVLSKYYEVINDNYAPDYDHVEGCNPIFAPDRDRFETILRVLVGQTPNSDISNWIDDRVTDYWTNYYNREHYKYLDLLYAILHNQNTYRSSGDLTYYDNYLNEYKCGTEWDDRQEYLIDNNLNNMLPQMLMHNLLKIKRNESYTLPQNYEINVTDIQSYPYRHNWGGTVYNTMDPLYGVFEASETKVVYANSNLTSTSDVGTMTDGEHNWNGYLEYRAGNKISLLPGFKVHQGAYFSAKINPECECKVRQGTGWVNTNIVCTDPPVIDHLEWDPDQEHICVHGPALDITPIVYSCECKYEGLNFVWTLTEKPDGVTLTQLPNRPFFPWEVGWWGGYVQVFDNNGPGNVVDFEFYVYERDNETYCTGMKSLKIDSTTTTSDTITSEIIFTEKLISILPNPTSGIVTISYNQDIPFIVEVTNTIGEKIYCSNYSLGSLVIDLTKQPKGLYFVKVSDVNNLLKIAQIIYQ